MLVVRKNPVLESRFKFTVGEKIEVPEHPTANEVRPIAMFLFKEDAELFCSSAKEGSEMKKALHDVKVVRIGLGEIVSNWGTYDGKPALFLEPVDPPGQVGESAEADCAAAGITKNTVILGGLILQFHSSAGADVIISDIKKALEDEVVHDASNHSAESED